MPVGVRLPAPNKPSKTLACACPFAVFSCPEMPQPSAIPISPLSRVLAGRALPQPVPAPASPRSDITCSGGETARELDQALQKSTTAYKNAFVEIAHFCHRLHEKQDWGTLGAGSEEEYFTSRGLARTWEMFVLLGARLAELSLDQMRELTAGSAQILAKIPEKLWGEFAWVDEARLLTTKEFTLLAKERLGELTRTKGLAEPKASLSLQVPLLRRDELERRIDSLRRQHHLHSPVDTLDFMLRIAEQGPGVVTAAERLDRCTEELMHMVDSEAADPADLGEIARLAARLRRHLKDLKRHANGFPGLPEEVTSGQLVEAGASHPA
jgi:hypothetical protein